MLVWSNALPPDHSSRRFGRERPHTPKDSMARFNKKSNKPTAKWVLMLVGLAVVYVLVQPLANRQFGWNLPALQALLPDRPVADPANVPPELEPTEPKEAKEVPGRTKTDPGSQATNSSPSKSPTQSKPQVEPNLPAHPPLPDVDLTVQAPRAPPSSSSGDVDVEPLLHGLLRSLGQEEYLSPAGLRYTRGSADGHRLKHLARHLEDQPDRSGRHGVFYGDMEQVLKQIDLGYTRAKQRSPKTSIREEDGRTVYEATFDEPIGFIGGREGARLRRPAANKLRLVTDQDRVITAFPY